MMACGSCDNDEPFTQAKGDFYRDLRVIVDRQTRH